MADEITEGAEEAEATRAKTKWARLEAIVGAGERLDLVAADLVEHWSHQPRPGKAIVVAMSRRIAVELYDRLAALRPDWHDDDPARGIVKVVMTGSAATRRATTATCTPRTSASSSRRGPKTRTPAGDRHRHQPAPALAEYSPTDREQAGVPIEKMVAVMLEKHDIVRGLLHGCAYDADPQLPAAQRMAAYATVLDVVMSDPDRKTRFLDQVLALSKAFALCASRDEALTIRNHVRLFADVRAATLKIDNSPTPAGWQQCRRRAGDRDRSARRRGGGRRRRHRRLRVGRHRDA